MRKIISLAVAILGILIAGMQQGAWMEAGYYKTITVGAFICGIVYTLAFIGFFLGIAHSIYPFYTISQNQTNIKETVKVTDLKSLSVALQEEKEFAYPVNNQELSKLISVLTSTMNLHYYGGALTEIDGEMYKYMYL